MNGSAAKVLDEHGQHFVRRIFKEHGFPLWNSFLSCTASKTAQTTPSDLSLLPIMASHFAALLCLPNFGQLICLSMLILSACAQNYGCIDTCDSYLTDLANTHNLEEVGNVYSPGSAITRTSLEYMCGDGNALTCYKAPCNGQGLESSQINLLVGWATVCNTRLATQDDDTALACWNSEIQSSVCVKVYDTDSASTTSSDQTTPSSQMAAPTSSITAMSTATPAVTSTNLPETSTTSGSDSTTTIPASSANATPTNGASGSASLQSGWPLLLVLTFLLAFWAVALW